jgi:hypothetical protein
MRSDQELQDRDSKIVNLLVSILEALNKLTEAVQNSNKKDK